MAPRSGSMARAAPAFLEPNGLSFHLVGHVPYFDHAHRTIRRCTPRRGRRPAGGGWRFTAGWRFSDATTLEARWLHVAQARYNASADIVPRRFAVGPALFDTWLFSPVFNFTNSFACEPQELGLGNLTTTALEFPYMQARELAVGSVPCLALRVTYVGELGWELYCPTESGLRLWDTLWEAGQGHGMVAAGYRAIDALRLEKGYRAWSSDLTPERTPDAAWRGGSRR